MIENTGDETLRDLSIAETNENGIDSGEIPGLMASLPMDYSTCRTIAA